VLAETATVPAPHNPGATPPLREQLRHQNPAVRTNAIAALGRLRTPDAVDVLCSALADQESEVRMEAADTLAKLRAPVAVDALCNALKHRDRYTRIAAAEALGAIGDPRAVPRLLEAHRRCFTGGSARGQLNLGLALAGGIALTFVAYLLGVARLEIGVGVAAFPLLFHGSVIYAQRRRTQGAVASAISAALLRIAEGTSAPEIHRIVPELRALVRDHVQQTPETRLVAQTTADRIEALTARLQQLPVTAVPAGTPEEQILPRPAAAPSADRSAFPS
jgi:hypothetical protein